MSSYIRPTLFKTIKNYLYLLFTGISKTKYFYVNRCELSEDEIIRYLPKNFYTQNENSQNQNINRFKLGCNYAEFLFSCNENNYYKIDFFNSRTQTRQKYIIKFQQNDLIKIQYNFHKDNYSGIDGEFFIKLCLFSFSFFLKVNFSFEYYYLVFIVGFLSINLYNHIIQIISYDILKRKFNFFIFILSSHKNKTLKIDYRHLI